MRLLSAEVSPRWRSAIFLQSAMDCDVSGTDEISSTKMEWTRSLASGWSSGVRGGLVAGGADFLTFEMVGIGCTFCTCALTDRRPDWNLQ